MKNFNNVPAQELYAICRENGCIEAVFQDIQLFKMGFEDQLSYIQMMTKDTVPNTVKVKLLEEIAQFFTQETKDCINYFISENRFVQLYDTFLVFEMIYAYYHLIIYTAFEMEADVVQSIMKKASEKTNRQLDTFELLVDKQLIGGMKLVTTDYVMDMTILNQLKQFNNSVR